MRIDLASAGDIAAALAAADGSVVLVMPVPEGATALALLRATLAHEAARRAPGVRINAICASPDAAAGAIAAAVGYLDNATATTGQLLVMGQAARPRPQGSSAASTTA